MPMVEPVTTATLSFSLSISYSPENQFSLGVYHITNRLCLQHLTFSAAIGPCFVIEYSVTKPSMFGMTIP
jgi:hypothetical protein